MREGVAEATLKTEELQKLLDDCAIQVDEELVADSAKQYVPIMYFVHAVATLCRFGSESLRTTAQQHAMVWSEAALASASLARVMACASFSTVQDRTALHRLLWRGRLPAGQGCKEDQVSSFRRRVHGQACRCKGFLPVSLTCLSCARTCWESCKCSVLAMRQRFVPVTLTWHVGRREHALFEE